MDPINFLFLSCFLPHLNGANQNDVLVAFGRAREEKALVSPLKM